MSQIIVQLTSLYIARSQLQYEASVAFFNSFCHAVCHALPVIDLLLITYVSGRGMQLRNRACSYVIGHSTTYVIGHAAGVNRSSTCACDVLCNNMNFK